MAYLWLEEPHHARTSAGSCHVPRSYGACALSGGQTFSYCQILHQYGMTKLVTAKVTCIRLVVTSAMRCSSHMLTLPGQTDLETMVVLSTRDQRT